MQEFYAITLDALKEGNNDRLWFKTNLKLCGLWFRSKEYGRAIRILKDLHRCATERFAWDRLLFSAAMTAAVPSMTSWTQASMLRQDVNHTPCCRYRSCQTEGGGDDLKKGTQLLEIYALEIQVTAW